MKDDLLFFSKKNVMEIIFLDQEPSCVWCHGNLIPETSWADSVVD